MKKLFEEFKAFISRGNVLDMAVGVVIATALKGTAKMAVPFVAVRQKNMCSRAQIREQRGSLRGSAAAAR